MLIYSSSMRLLIAHLLELGRCLKWERIGVFHLAHPVVVHATEPLQNVVRHLPQLFGTPAFER